jgi:EmrB/QacA subfamily drug resistance transporter
MNTKRWTLLAAVLGSSVVFLDGIVLPVALPAIGREPRLFVGVLEGQNYIQYGYLLSLSSLLVLAGALSDFYGRRRLFIVGLVGFGAASLLCGLAPNVETLILFRILQGAAGALLVPGSLAILTNAFTGEEQGRAFGIWAGASGLAAIGGPIVGGVLVQEVSWRAIFLLNAPFIAIAIWAAWRYVGESRDEQSSGHFDWLGALLVALAVGGLVFGGIYGEAREWKDPIAFIALAVGGIATVTMPIYFNRVAHPLIPLSMFRSRNFTVTNISTLLIYGALYVNGAFQPIFAVGTLGYTPTAVGAAVIPGSLFLVFLSARFGGLAGRLGPRVFMTVGPVIMSIGILWLVRIPATSQPWRLSAADPATYLPSGGYLVDILPASLLFGLGLAIMVAPLTTALMRSVPPRQAGLASAINNAISRVGPQLAGALIFVLLTAGFYSALAVKLPGVDVNSAQLRAQVTPLNAPADGTDAQVVAAAHDASTDVFHMAMLVTASMLAIGAAVNWFGISDKQALEAGGARGAAGSA